MENAQANSRARIVADNEGAAPQDKSQWTFRALSDWPSPFCSMFSEESAFMAIPLSVANNVSEPKKLSRQKVYEEAPDDRAGNHVTMLHAGRLHMCWQT